MKIDSKYLNVYRIKIVMLTLALASIFFSNSIAFGQSTGELPTNVEIVGTTSVFVDDFNDNMIK